MAFRLAILILVVCGPLLIRGSQAETSAPGFESAIQPLLADKCGKCHSEKVRKGGLDLSSIRGLVAGGESEVPMIGDSIDDSLLWLQIEGGDMPPEGEPQLNQEEFALLQRWVATSVRSDEFKRLSSNNQLNQHDVLPIFLLRCTTCHGPRLQEGDLDLRTRDAMLKGGTLGPALVPGDAKASLILQRIESGACPPREKLLKFFVRRPPASEVEIIRQWIESGAPKIDIPADVANDKPDPLVTDEDRKHWAFQPPKAKPGSRSIDEFIARRLHGVGLDFSPQANRDTQIRRAYLDLTGMPPSLERWQSWRSSSDPNWYATMIDELLASPQYGQRWGRYWLDLAGYADSEGGISADPVRPLAWKYRDYVIAAFNDDKPYDRFLLEQLAGDELADYASASVVTDEMVDNLIATGFLRMGIDETGSRTMNFVPERLKVINDAITVVSAGLMGLTMECARCHSHKYDPIPHRDYYRLKAVFQGALDEHDWSSFKTRTLKVATTKHRAKVASVNPPLEKEIKRLQSLQKKAIATIQIELLRHHYPEQSDADNNETLTALKKADNNRTLPQKVLVERLQRAEVLPDSEQPDSVLEARRRSNEIQHQIESIRRQMAPSLGIRALWDFGRPSPTYILRRGEHDKPGRPVGPGVPAALTDGRTPFVASPPFPNGTHKTGRRLAFARWLTQPDHPLTARVMVNRIWYHHFGTGLVKDLGNFGVKGDRPSHPDLLDWLALEFVDQGWSIKELHRLIMNSRTYRQSSQITDRKRALDPQNRLLSRMPLRRLDAETIRDSLLFVADQLDHQMGGLPDPVAVGRGGLVSAKPTDGGGWRRSVYLQYRRTEIPSMMDTFDYPQMGPNCIARIESNVSPQALMLMNNGRVRELAAAFASRVRAIVQGSEDRGSFVDAAYGLALSRPPSEQERRIGIESLRELESAWQEQTDKALETYCHTILNSAAFLYVD